MKNAIVFSAIAFVATGAGATVQIDRSAMSDAYWEIWSDREQAKIDVDIEVNRKADATVEVAAPDGAYTFPK